MAGAVLGILLAASTGLARDSIAQLPPKLPKYPKTSTRFDDIYAKLDQDTVAEAAARLNALAKDYSRRTSSFQHPVTGKLPIYFFDNREEYTAAGGPVGSAGVYTHIMVLALYLPEDIETLWPPLQHECWHQFEDATAGHYWPPWLDEGLAEYYSEAIWTGDEFITGVISPVRLERVQTEIRNKSFGALNRLLDMDRRKWNEEAKGEEYDQAWSMVHFLAHAESSKYRDALVALIKEATRGRPGQESFRKVFGPNYIEAKAECEKWWLALQVDATRDRYVQATVSTLTSYLARAHVRGLKFKSAEEFFDAAKDGKLLAAAQASRPLWLPKSLLDDHLKNAERLQKWTLLTAGRNPELRLQQDGGPTLVGKFDVQPAVGISVVVRSVKGKE